MAELVMHTTVYWTVPEGVEPKDYMEQFIPSISFNARSFTRFFLSSTNAESSSLKIKFPMGCLIN